METTRFGNYVLKEKIASGVMADICRALREGLMGVAREVCIKRIKKEFSGDAAFVAMFIDEVRISARRDVARLEPPAPLLCQRAGRV